MKNDIPKTYPAKEVEDEIYKIWENSGFFNPDNLNLSENAETFSIAMPPPNATGELHLGHATFLTIQDIIIRFQRMRGKRTLYLPGTDHAAIATQNKVEKLLKKEKNLSREDLGREKFLEEVNAFVNRSQDTIKNQIRKMGASCDWSREHYTMDPQLSKAVTEVFVRMYKNGLIYRGERIVNWCPRCASTLADDEVDYKPEKTKFYYMKYGPITIGTARPETKFLDKTIVVHPNDERYKKIVGKTFAVPWINGEVQASVIADPAVDMNFGTGAMTITPAHSFADFDIAKRHNLPIIQIINEQGILTDAAGEFAGKNAHEAREEIVQKMQDNCLIEKIDEEYDHQISVCYRCVHVVEPLISAQWFIDVNTPSVSWKGKKVSLKEAALDAGKSDDIDIIPDRFNKTYFQWMENLRDWCISRQIWFGHRIPVWYCIGDTACKRECKEPIVSSEPPSACPHCGSKNLEQDPDVLDTWFSSGLWTFSTLGWPQETQDLKTYHPTSVLETGYDILFFWVARMILMSSYCLGEVPFKKVYLHGLVRDKQGRKMSKSLGNGIDPLEMVEKYGTDAVRLSLVIGTSPGNDVRLYEEKIVGYRNFVNKLWNISRFILMGAEKSAGVGAGSKGVPWNTPTLADKWILKKFAAAAKQTTEDLEAFRFSQAGETLRAFTWNDFADWYLEIAKIERGKENILLYLLKNLLRLWHPFMPFVTERIYSLISDKLLMADEWTYAQEEYLAYETDAFLVIKEIITAIRNTWPELKIPSQQSLEISLSSEKHHALIHAHRTLIETLGRATLVENIAEHKAIPLSNGGTLFINANGVENQIDSQKAQQETKTLKAYTAQLKKTLGNEAFLKNAKPSVIQEKKEKLQKAEERLKKFSQH